MEANPYADHQNMNFKAVHDSHINLLEHLHRESEAHKMAAETKANEADIEALTGFSNILNKIGEKNSWW